MAENRSGFHTEKLMLIKNTVT